MLTVMLMNLNWLFPTELYLKCLFRLNTGNKLDLNDPKTFGEKIQWLKLFDRKQIYSRMVDKATVKEYVGSIIGNEYIIPTLGIWDKPYQIPWNDLPNKFVLKTTHGGGSSGVVICKDKTCFSTDTAITRLNHSMKQNIWRKLREWPYKNVKPRILAEKYIDPLSEDDLTDYKWYCFDGEPKYCQVIQNRSKKETINFFDTNWKHQEFVGLNPSAVQATVIPSRPRRLDKQLEIARLLSQNIPFVRIDLYEDGDIVYFGEITFYPRSGMGSFKPIRYNDILGQMIKLPINNKQ